MFHVANMLSKITVKDVPINDYELLNIEVCSFEMFEEAVHPISCDKLRVLSSSPNIY